jgi:hypothetical protein
MQQNINRWLVSPGQQVYASVTVYNASAGARNLAVSIRFYDTSGSSTGTQLDVIGPGAQSIPSGGSYTFNWSAVAPPLTVSAGVNVNRDSTGSAVSGDIYYADNVYLGSLPSSYADGSSPGWTWNGIANASTSTGPPL